MPAPVTGISVGSRRDTVAVIGMTWKVRGFDSMMEVAVTTNAGRANPGSLPRGTPKSTRTMSPARMCRHVVQAGLEQLLLGRVRLGGRKGHSDSSLPLGSGQPPDLVVEREPINLGQLAKLVSRCLRDANGSRILHIVQYTTEFDDTPAAHSPCRTEVQRCYDALMRTTIDLKPDLHRIALAIARDQRKTLSETINELLAQALTPREPTTVTTSPTTGLPTVRLGRVITIDDVRELDDTE